MSPAISTSTSAWPDQGMSTSGLTSERSILEPGATLSVMVLA
jgi:hypothetical protein